MFDRLPNVGPWRLLAQDDIPQPTRDYFVAVARVAWAGLEACGVYPGELLAGPVFLVPAEMDKAGWYKKADDTAYVAVHLDARTGFGGNPAAHYGSEYRKSCLAHSLVHEVLHRIWFRHLGVKGQAIWSLGRHRLGPTNIPAQEAWAEMGSRLALADSGWGGDDALVALIGSAMEQRGGGAEATAPVETTEARIQQIAERYTPQDALGRSLRRLARLW